MNHWAVCRSRLGTLLSSSLARLHVIQNPSQSSSEIQMTTVKAACYFKAFQFCCTALIQTGSSRVAQRDHQTIREVQNMYSHVNVNVKNIYRWRRMSRV